VRHAVERVDAPVVRLGESPLWDRAVGLRWLDVAGQVLHTLGREPVPLPETVSAIELTTGPDLLAVTATGFGLLDPDTGRLTPVASTVDDPMVSMNDGGIDPRGRCLAGSAVRDGSRRGALYRLDERGVATVAGDIGMSNGIDWSPEGGTLYHVDSTAGTVRVFDYDEETGEVGDMRVLRSVPAAVGLPDGLTVAADGAVWLAVWGAGEVWRLDPDTGATTAVVSVPTPYPTSCAFGGPELSTLYVTTADHEHPPGGGFLYAAEVPGRGRDPHRFAGGPS
jgi:sugar lactone lactonase YvrE